MSGLKNISEPTSAEGPEEKAFKVRRGQVDSLSLYEITDYELDILERGSPSGIFLNLSVFLFTLGASFWIALETTSLEVSKTFIIFAILATVGILGGVVFGILWYRNRESVKSIVIKIKSRMPSEEVSE